jgi:hypothetical protein
MTTFKNRIDAIKNPKDLKSFTTVHKVGDTIGTSKSPIKSIAYVIDSVSRQAAVVFFLEDGDAAGIVLKPAGK